MTPKQQTLKELYQKTDANALSLVKLFHNSLCHVPDAKVAEELAKVSANLAEIKADIDKWIEDASNRK